MCVNVMNTPLYNIFLCFFILLSVSACNPDPRGDVDPDTYLPGIGAGRPQQSDTRQVSVNPDYYRTCENGMSHVQVFTTGQLLNTDIYLPDKAIHILKNRGTDFTYPISVTIKPACILFPMEVDCDKSPLVMGVAAATRNANMNVLRNSVLGRTFNMEPTPSDIDGLYRYVFSQKLVEDQVKEGFMAPEFAEHLISRQASNEAFSSFQKNDDISQTFTLLSRCNYHGISRKERPCVWSIVSPYGSMTSSLTSRESLSDWQDRLKINSEILQKISEKGEFANDCKL